MQYLFQSLPNFEGFYVVLAQKHRSCQESPLPKNVMAKTPLLKFPRVERTCPVSLMESFIGYDDLPSPNLASRPIKWFDPSSSQNTPFHAMAFQAQLLSLTKGISGTRVGGKGSSQMLCGASNVTTQNKQLSKVCPHISLNQLAFLWLIVLVFSS